MLLLAHAGITVGLTWLVEKSTPWVRARIAGPVPGNGVAHSLDYRLLLVGSVLPDIIDKPLGVWLLRETLGSGRILGHTLLFATVLTGVGLYLYISRRRPGLLCLVVGTLAHLILDQIWFNPRTLFWPLYGLTFEKDIVEDWLPGILTALATDPRVYVPEIIGALLLAVFLWYIIRHGKFASFLRSGRVN